MYIKNNEIERLKIKVMIDMLKEKPNKNNYILQIINSYYQNKKITEKQEDNLYKYEFRVGTKKRLDVYVNLLTEIKKVFPKEKFIITEIKNIIFSDLKYDCKLLKKYVLADFNFSILKHEKRKQIFINVYKEDVDDFIYYNIDKKQIVLCDDEILLKSMKY